MDEDEVESIEVSKDEVESKQDEALAYSEDIFSVKYDDGALLPNVLSSIFFAPIRLIIRVMFYYMVLPSNMQADLWESTAIVSGICALFLGMISLATKGTILLIVVCIVMAGASILMSRKCQNAVPAVSEKRRIKLKKRTVSKICETIYDKLDNL